MAENLSQKRKFNQNLAKKLSFNDEADSISGGYDADSELTPSILKSFIGDSPENLAQLKFVPSMVNVRTRSIRMEDPELPVPVEKESSRVIKEDLDRLRRSIEQEHEPLRPIDVLSWLESNSRYSNMNEMPSWPWQEQEMELQDEDTATENLAKCLKEFDEAVATGVKPSGLSEMLFDQSQQFRTAFPDKIDKTNYKNKRFMENAGVVSDDNEFTSPPRKLIRNEDDTSNCQQNVCEVESKEMDDLEVIARGLNLNEC